VTVLDIANYAANRILGKSVNINDAIDWINDALDQMGTDARRFSSSQLSSVESGTWYDLPADCLKVDEVLNSNGKEYPFWLTDGTRIKFRASDTLYTLHYYRNPNKVTAQTDTPDCPDAFHLALAYYVAYRFDDRDFPGSEMAAARFNEFLTHYNNAKEKLQKKDRYIRVWRWC